MKQKMVHSSTEKIASYINSSFYFNFFKEMKDILGEEKLSKLISRVVRKCNLEVTTDVQNKDERASSKLDLELEEEFIRLQE